MYTPNCELKPGVAFPEQSARIALKVEYDGAMFQGFQRQKSAKRTVQGALETAISKLANTPLTLVCAGRTDARVHARGQYVHFDTDAQRPEKAWMFGVNTYLPDDIRVTAAASVRPEFHARFSARARCYHYYLLSSKVRPAIARHYVSSTRYTLDIDAMAAAARHLIGEHDFSAFRSSICQASNPIRTLTTLDIAAISGGLFFKVKANAFLHHMVRNLVGSLIEVGRGARSGDWLKSVLLSGDRSLAGPTAPPEGLYLQEVDYPEGLLPQRFLETPDALTILSG